MKRKYHTPEQIIKKLRQADAIVAQGGTVDQACSKLEISDATYYNWRKQYGQMKLDQVKQLKSLQKENAQLKKLVAELSLDKAILKEALSEITEPGKEAKNSRTYKTTDGCFRASGMRSYQSAKNDAAL
jgi:putative transposase